MADGRGKEQAKRLPPVVDAVAAMKTIQAVEMFTGVTVDELRAKIQQVRAQGLEPFVIDIPIISVDGVPFRFNRVPHVQIGAAQKKVHEPEKPAETSNEAKKPEEPAKAPEASA